MHDEPPRPLDLPDFTDPPLVEVAMGVQFERLRELRQPHIGIVWSAFRDDYPDVRDLPPLAPLQEGRQRGGPSFTVEFADAPDLPRSWFMSLDGERLVQLQPDRFVHNWRKGDQAPTYPRYEALRRRFVEAWSTFAAALSEVGIGPPVVRQVEIAYVNVVSIGAAVAGLSPTGPSLDDVRGDPLERSFHVRYALAAKEGWGPASLAVEVRPQEIIEGGAEQLLTLTVRGVTAEPKLESALAAFDRGREVIVRAFTVLTSADQHRAWGRTQ